MAMGPGRSNPLHNFMFPCLKWGNRRFLSCKKLPYHSSENAGDRHSPATSVNNSRDSDRRTGVTKPQIHDDDRIDAVREKLMLDLKIEANRMKDEILGKEVAKGSTGDDGETEPAVAVAVEKETAPTVTGARIWNLRSRRAPFFRDTWKGLRIEEGSSPLSTYNSAVKFRGSPEKEERQKFSLTLSKKEIEEDFMKLVGHRPPRKPKKKPKNLQKQLDTIFPGTWLSEVTAHSYKVPKASENGKLTFGFDFLAEVALRLVEALCWLVVGNSV
ncbi:hypothetical protein VNO77_12127 [Canavalia gladiata]|uniref:Uncharacterized protein n=1 Tax=Canavalia gladiata TaxID=3824 RepID=A0AAN9LVX4_CANGL